MTRSAWLVFLVSTVGCSASASGLSVADQHLAQGDLPRAALEYDAELASAATAQEAARARLLGTLVDLKLQRSERALEELRYIAYQNPGSTWGLFAGMLADEMGRARVLRETLIQTGAELHEMRQSLATHAQTLESVRKESAEQQAELAALKEERMKLQAHARDANERSAQLLKRARELEQELDALKHIDMERQP